MGTLRASCGGRNPVRNDGATVCGARRGRRGRARPLGQPDRPEHVGFRGVVGAAELDARPRMRTGEILEVVPGLIVTQHSGTGKSNQMFLRGFNLDHGTDFATWIDGMPVNLPTHAHGQGYTDLNFLIPELVERLEYRKGAYYAEVSDFSSAGAAYMSTYERLPEGMVKAGSRRGRLLQRARGRQLHRWLGRASVRRAGAPLRRSVGGHRRGREAQQFAAALLRPHRERRLERRADGL